MMVVIQASPTKSQLNMIEVLASGVRWASIMKVEMGLSCCAGPASIYFKKEGAAVAQGQFRGGEAGYHMQPSLSMHD